MLYNRIIYLEIEVRLDFSILKRFPTTARIHPNIVPLLQLGNQQVCSHIVLK